MMATESFKRCDLTGSRKDVKTYKVLVIEISETGEDDQPIIDITKDLCPRIIRRLVANIQRSLTKCGAPKGKTLVETK